MATVTEAPPECPPKEGPYLMTAATFLRAVEADVFPEKDNVFLRKGLIYTKMAKKLPHSAASETVRTALISVLPAGWGLWGENPILTDAFSAPLPDLCVIRGSAQDYYQRANLPTAEDVALVVEVAHSSLDIDRTEALANYAGAGLPIYWIVNLIDWQVEVYTDPETADGIARYRSRTDFQGDQEVPFTIDGVEVARVPARLVLPGERRRDP